MRADEDDLRRWWWIFGFGLSLQYTIHTCVCCIYRVYLYLYGCRLRFHCLLVRCVQRLFCMRVGKRVYVCASSFFLLLSTNTRFLGVLCSPGSHMHVCTCIRMRWNETLKLPLPLALLLSRRSLRSFFFIICYFISIELAINAEPLFSFRIKPTFFHSILCLFSYNCGVHPLLCHESKRTDFSAPNGEKLSTIHIDWFATNTQKFSHSNAP